jgi:hypothetical protein
MSIYKPPVSDERIAFEAWYSASHTSASLARSSKGYIRETTRVAWRAWQAACAGGAAAERERIVQILANNNPRNNGKATTIYSMYGDEQFDNGWLVAVETKLFAIRAKGAA